MKEEKEEWDEEERKLQQKKKEGMKKKSFRLPLMWWKPKWKKKKKRQTKTRVDSIRGQAMSHTRLVIHNLCIASPCFRHLLISPLHSIRAKMWGESTSDRPCLCGGLILVNLSTVAAAEEYRPVVRVTPKARNDPSTLRVGMRRADGCKELKGRGAYVLSRRWDWGSRADWTRNDSTVPQPPLL